MTGVSDGNVGATRSGSLEGNGTSSAGTANWTIKMLQKIFQIRVCDDSTFRNRKRPCILYQIKRCSGPCVGYIDKSDYKKTVDQAILFVSGKSRDIQKNLSKEMEAASDELDFEKASIFRDRIKSLNIIQSSQRINEANLVDADVIAAYKESGKTCIQVFFYRSKQNWGNQAYFPKHDPDQDISEIMSSFLMQFYENKNVPKLVPGWTQPIVIGRHAFGDQYRATDFLIPGEGKMEIKWTSKDGKDKKEFEVFNFTGPGIALSMYNLDDSIRSFARACMNFGLVRKWPVYLSTKNTILKAYDGRFKDLFQEVYEKEYQEKFKENNIIYEQIMVVFLIYLSYNLNFKTK